jgi:hypothetical protein
MALQSFPNGFDATRKLLVFVLVVDRGLPGPALTRGVGRRQPGRFVQSPGGTIRSRGSSGTAIGLRRTSARGSRFFLAVISRTHS